MDFLYNAFVWIIAKALILLFILGVIGFFVYIIQLIYCGIKGKSIGRFPFWPWF